MSHDTWRRKRLLEFITPLCDICGLYEPSCCYGPCRWAVRSDCKHNRQSTHQQSGLNAKTPPSVRAASDTASLSPARGDSCLGLDLPIPHNVSSIVTGPKRVKSNPNTTIPSTCGVGACGVHRLPYLSKQRGRHPATYRQIPSPHSHTL